MIHHNSNYDKFPTNSISGFDGHCFESWDVILEHLASILAEKRPGVIAVECYHGVDHQELMPNLQTLHAVTLIDVSTIYKSAEEIGEMVYPEVTDDPVFGKITTLTIDDYLDPVKLTALRKRLDQKSGTLILYGTGASRISPKPDIIIYADMARWEIQLRMRRNTVNNLGVENKERSFNFLYKQAYFVDWRVCDRIKIDLLDSIDYLIDSNIPDSPKMITGEALRAGLQQVADGPFRVVPFFDPGPWGGQWMKEICDLDRQVENFAWGFDCVPEENSLLLKFGDITVEIPSVNLVYSMPKQVLGQEIYEVLGPEFPIRFDFLDTMQGGNLSLQVHPSVEYIREHFGMSYTQDESYYLLDAGENAIVYLGLKPDINPEAMISDLKLAQKNGKIFKADDYVQSWQVKKHDHVLIPAGTVHCSGKNSMVLEISATPYIFTFKLWDWGRMGLDGKPRPINIEHGEQVIAWERDKEWTEKNLVHQVKTLDETEWYREEVTGLHKLEFIETRRHWFTSTVHHHTGNTVNVLNLVEGREVIVESPDNSFAPFVVHYAETFIVPAQVGPFTIRPFGESDGTECATVKAYIRPDTLRKLGNDLWMIKKNGAEK